MANASKDNNNVSTILGTSSSDGSTTVRVKAHATNHTLQVSDGVTGSDLSGDNASRDSNMVPALMAVSSVDGVTPVPIYADSSTGELLIKTT